MAVTFCGLCLLLYTSVASAITCYRMKLDYTAYMNSEFDDLIYKKVATDFCTKSRGCCGSYCCTTYYDSYYYSYSYYSDDSVSTGGIAAAVIGCVVGFTILIVCLRIMCLCCKDTSPASANRRTRNNVAVISTRTSTVTASRNNGTSNPSFTDFSSDAPAYTPYSEPPPSYDEVIKAEQLRNNGASPFPMRELSSTSSQITNQNSGVILTPPSPNSV